MIPPTMLSVLPFLRRAALPRRTAATGTVARVVPAAEARIISLPTMEMALTVSNPGKMGVVEINVRQRERARIRPRN